MVRGRADILEIADTMGRKRKIHKEFLAACRDGDLAKVSKALRPSLLDRQDVDGHTPLMTACQTGQINVADFLLERGADVHIRDLEGRTALHWASLKMDQPALVRRLLDHGAEVNAVSNLGLTPLHYAVILGFGGNVTSLLNAQADLTLLYMGKTAAELARHYGHSRIAAAVEQSQAEQ